MGLFDKKTCDICGAKIGLLGNRKLEDGNLCKDCAGRLSPWFEGRRHSTLADIKVQLADREANKEKVAGFTVTGQYGEHSPKLFIDQTHGNFAVCSERDLTGGNPDIIPLSAVTACNCETKEFKHEEKWKNEKGEMVSYVPPRYEYSYDYYCEIKVDHPYIDDIRFRINDTTIKSGGLGSIMLRQKLSTYEEMCDTIKSVMTKGGAAPAPAAAASGEVRVMEVNLPSVPFSFDPYGTGNLCVAFSVNGIAHYRYNPTASDQESAIRVMLQSTFMDLEKEGVEGFKVINDLALFLVRMKASFDKLGPTLGTEVVSFSLQPMLLPESQKLLADAQALAATRGPVPTSQPADGEWTCPSCGGLNTGNFCVYCGAKKA